MARTTLNIRFDINRLHCRDEGDGWGSAEPYLWTVFFKVDGSTVSVSPSLSLTGDAVIRTTPGSHGNLGDTDVDEDDIITVPVAIGEWETDLRPILVPPPLDAIQPDVGGVIGVVCVLMEEDNVSDAGAEAGHQALNDGVRAAVNQIVATRTVTNQDVTDAELAGFESQITDAVSSAIQDQQSFFENLWSWFNADDSIGFTVFLFAHDDLAQAGTVAFSQRFRNEGDWELSGTLTATSVCPVNIFDVLFSSRSLDLTAGAAARDELVEQVPAAAELADARPAATTFDIDALRRFRDGPYRELPGLAAWWRLAERNTASVALALTRSPELRDQAASLLAYASEICLDPEAKLDPAVLKQASEVLTRLAGSTRSRRLRIDASRAADVVAMLDGRTWAEGCKALDSVRPSRHPVVAGLGVRLGQRRPKPGAAGGVAPDADRLAERRGPAR
jgi:hypothetical protein